MLLTFGSFSLTFYHFFITIPLYRRYTDYIIMSKDPQKINCGIRKFQIDGRISLTDIMHRHNLKPYQKIEIFIKVVENHD